MASSSVFSERVLEALDTRVPAITARTAEMEQGTEDLDDQGHRVDLGRKDTAMLLAIGAYSGSTYQPQFEIDWCAP